MNARKMASAPQASADPLGELYAMRAEEAPEPVVHRWQERTEYSGRDRGTGSPVVVLLAGAVSGFIVGIILF